MRSKRRRSGPQRRADRPLFAYSGLICPITTWLREPVTRHAQRCSASHVRRSTRRPPKRPGGRCRRDRPPAGVPLRLCGPVSRATGQSGGRAPTVEVRPRGHVPLICLGQHGHTPTGLRALRHTSQLPPTRELPFSGRATPPRAPRAAIDTRPVVLCRGANALRLSAGDGAPPWPAGASSLPANPVGTFRGSALSTVVPVE
jgi:hypothetical protein